MIVIHLSPFIDVTRGAGITQAVLNLRESLSPRITQFHLPYRNNPLLFFKLLYLLFKFRNSDAIIHHHGIYSFLFPLLFLFHIVGFPIVVSPHGMLDSWALNSGSSLKSLYIKYILPYVMSFSTVHLLCFSEYNSCRLLPVFPKRQFILPNVVTSEFDVTNPPPCEHKVFDFKFLYIGRIAFKKGIHILLKAWKLSLPYLPESATLTLVGDFSNDYARKLVIPERVHIRPFISGASKFDLIANSTFTVLPSLSEGLPMTVIESLASGTIPVISNACNFDDLISSNIAFPASLDPVVLSQQLVRLCTISPFTLSHLSECCFDYYVNRYSPTSLTPRYLDSYLSLL